MSEQSLPSFYPSSDIRLAVSNLSYLENGPYSLQLHTAECIGLHGRSGVGKTQFLKAIIDLVPHQGEVALDGMLAQTMPAPLWRSKVVMVAAEPSWWHDRVGDHFSLVSQAEGIASALQVFGFREDVFGWQVHRLSTGEKQRLAIIRALAIKPEVLLLDEPSSSLDEGNTLQLEKLIRNYLKQKHGSVIWVSHDQDQLGRVADRIFELTSSGLIGPEGTSMDRLCR